MKNYVLGILRCLLRDRQGDIESKSLADEYGLWAMEYKFGIYWCVVVTLKHVLKCEELHSKFEDEGTEAESSGHVSI